MKNFNNEKQGFLGDVNFGRLLSIDEDIESYSTGVVLARRDGSYQTLPSNSPLGDVKLDSSLVNKVEEKIKEISELKNGIHLVRTDHSTGFTHDPEKKIEKLFMSSVKDLIVKKKHPEINILDLKKEKSNIFFCTFKKAINSLSSKETDCTYLDNDIISRRYGSISNGEEIATSILNKDRGVVKPFKAITLDSISNTYAKFSRMLEKGEIRLNKESIDNFILTGSFDKPACKIKAEEIEPRSSNLELFPNKAPNPIISILRKRSFHEQNGILPRKKTRFFEGCNDVKPQIVFGKKGKIIEGDDLLGDVFLNTIKNTISNNGNLAISICDVEVANRKNYITNGMKDIITDKYNLVYQSEEGKRHDILSNEKKTEDFIYSSLNEKVKSILYNKRTFTLSELNENILQKETYSGRGL